MKGGIAIPAEARKKLGHARLRDRFARMRFDTAEMSGALGDLGTFIPLAASLIIVCGLDAGTVLFFAGFFNIITGVLFNQPIPVQPMKAIAAVAIAEKLLPPEIAAAGFAAGAVILLLGLTGLVSWAEEAIPRPVVRGIQLGVGLKLAVKGMAMVLGLSWTGLDSRSAGLVAVMFLLAAGRWKSFPSALVLFVSGLAVVLAGHRLDLAGVPLGWGGPIPVMPSLSEWRSGILQGALPQIPLTLLNSVIALCALSGDFYPGKGVRTRPMAISVGLMNLSGCLLGAMPACHGSGGLAGQHHFGARTGGSVVMLGGAKMLLGVLFGSAALAVMRAYPTSILGVMLAYAGIELTLPARDCVRRDAFFIAAATAGGILAFNTWFGFLVGLTASAFLLGRKHPQRKTR